MGRRILPAAALLGLFALAAPVAAQDGGDAAPPPGITVTGYGEATAPAEQVSLQLLVGDPGGAYSGPQAPDPDATPGAEERARVAPVVDALVAAGVAEEDISVVVSPVFSGVYGPGGPGSARIDVSVEGADLERVNELIDAASVGAAQERLSVSQVGARYEVDDCDALERAAREAAIADARERANLQAELLGVELGDVVASSDGARDAATTAGYFGLATVLGSCEPAVPSGFSGNPITLAPFDPTTPAEVAVYTSLALTFAIAEGNAS